MDTFGRETPHFLDIEISPDGLSVYHKPTQTGQYTHFSSNTPWRFKTAWISALVHRAKLICSPIKLHQELKVIRKYISWNSFQKHIGNKIINKTLDKQPKTNDKLVNDEYPQTIYFNLLFIFYFQLVIIKMKNSVIHNKKYIYI